MDKCATALTGCLGLLAGLTPDEQERTFSALGALLGIRQNGSGSRAETKQSLKGAAKGSSKSPKGGSGSTNSAGSKKKSIPSYSEATSGAVRVPDLSELVRTEFGPLLALLPAPRRQEGAIPPRMDAKSVRRRLNKKRSGLHKILTASMACDQGDDSNTESARSHAFMTLNSLQGFRIGMKDASRVGVELSISPIPEGWQMGGFLVAFLEELLSRESPSEKVLDTGFFPDPNHEFVLNVNDGERASVPIGAVANAGW